MIDVKMMLISEKAMMKSQNIVDFNLNMPDPAFAWPAKMTTIKAINNKSRKPLKKHRIRLALFASASFNITWIDCAIWNMVLITSNPSAKKESVASIAQTLKKSAF